MRLFPAAIVVSVFSSCALGQPYTIQTLAGGGLPVNIPGTSAVLYGPATVAVDAAHNLYFPAGDTVVLRLDATTGVLTLAAGNGTPGYSGDDGPAANAQLNGATGVAVDSAGNLYIADYGNQRIRKVSNGVITTVAGNGIEGYSGDGGPATSAELDHPSGIAVDAAGNLYIIDAGNDRIRKVSNGVITTVAGNGVRGYSGDNGPATSAQLAAPYGIAVDGAGNLYIADNQNFRVRKVSNGVITTVAGNGTQGYSGDNVPATSAELAWPVAVAVDGAGNLYIADGGSNSIRKVSNGVIATVAGNGFCCGFGGDNGPAISAQLYAPNGIVADAAGNLYIADSGNDRIRRVSNGMITTVAGGAGAFGDNGPATGAELWVPEGVAVDPSGSVYIADAYCQRIRKVSNGVITTVAGGASESSPAGGGYGGDNGPAASAQLHRPSGVAVDSAGNLYIADNWNHRVRKVSNGIITTVAGNGAQGYGGDNGPATSAQLCFPGAVAVDAAGNLYIADTRNNRIRKVLNGVITTVAGNGTSGFSGDNGSATSAELSYPAGVAVDAAGNLYIADDGNYRVRKVSNGLITTVAGNGLYGYSGDNGPASGARVDTPFGVAVDAAGNLYIAELNGQHIRKVSNGLITTVAGNGTSGFSGDNGPAASAQVHGPQGVAVDSAGNVYIADAGNDRIRVLTPPHPAFFAGEEALPNGAYYLLFPNDNTFGFYTYMGGGLIYHFDLGYGYVSPGNGPEAYWWDLSTGHWWYTSSITFPFLYDFTLNAWIYYFPDTQRAGHYTTNPRYFANMTTGRIFSM